MAPVPEVGNGIKAVRAPGMAAADARGSKPSPPPSTVAIDGLQGVFGTGWQVTAFVAEQRL